MRTSQDIRSLRWTKLIVVPLLVGNLATAGWLIRRHLTGKEYRPVYAQHRIHILSSLSLRRTAIVMLGDSLTNWCEWSELLDDPRIVNRGVNGIKVAELRQALTALISEPPAQLFVLVGINDLLAGASTEQLLDDYRALLADLRTRLPLTKITIQSLLPIDPTLAQTSLGPKVIEKSNAALRVLAAENDVSFLNLYDEFVDERSMLKSRFTYDGVHLNGDGYRVWQDKLAPRLLRTR